MRKHRGLMARSRNEIKSQMYVLLRILSEIKLKRTDTTIDLSQKAWGKKMKCMGGNL